MSDFLYDQRCTFDAELHAVIARANPKVPGQRAPQWLGY